MNRKQTTIALLLILCFFLSPLSALDFAYNEDLSTASDITLGLTLIAPGAIGFVAPPSDYLTVATSYAWTMVEAYTVRTVLKQVIHKPRPYVQDGVPLPDGVKSEKNYESFPSGHTLMAFSAAAYTQTMQILFYPDSKAMKAVSATTWALALGTAVLRVVSGCHYTSDVVAGAAIGSAIGFLGPYLTHRMQQKDANAPKVLTGSLVGVQVSF